LLDSFEDGFFPWPPKTTAEPHSSSLFSVQGESESLPFSEKPPETLNDQASIHVSRQVLLSVGFRNAPRVKAND
jgi:hypothetical protein